MSTTTCAPTLTLPRFAEEGTRSRPRGRGRLRAGTTCLGLIISNIAHAQTTAPEGPSLLPLVLTLIFVLALIPVAVWMLKRLGAGNVASAAGLKIVGQLSIGQRERLVVVESGDRWLILGVTASSINRIGTMPRGELPPPSSPTASFAQLLMNARKGRDHG